MLYKSEPREEGPSEVFGPREDCEFGASSVLGATGTGRHASTPHSHRGYTEYTSQHHDRDLHRISFEVRKRVWRRMELDSDREGS